MSLSDQIADLEAALVHTSQDAEAYERSCNQLKDENEELNEFLEDAEAFIAYIDKTNPELRTAYEATKILEGATT